MWFDTDELATALGGAIPPIEPAALPTDDEPRCPACPSRLATRTAAAVSGLEIEVCRMCHGVFLAPGELVALRREAQQIRRTDQAAGRIRLENDGQHGLTELRRRMARNRRPVPASGGPLVRRSPYPPASPP